MRNFNLNLDSVEHGLDLPKLKPSTDVAPEPIHKEALFLQSQRGNDK